MTVPTEQQVLGKMGIKGLRPGAEAVGELLTALGYIDVAKELLLRVDETLEQFWDDEP